MKSFAFLALALVCGFAHAGGYIGNVPWDTNSNVLRIPLIDEDTPVSCPSTDLTYTSSGLQIDVSTDVTNGFYDTFKSSDSTLETITTIGTYATPTATKARFKVSAAGSCWYELQLPDAAFEIANANRLYIEVTDGAAEIMDDTFWVDLTGVPIASLADAVWDEALSGHTTAGTSGKYLGTDVPAILVDTGTTLDGKLDTTVTAVATTIPALVNTAAGYMRVWSGVVSSVTSQTVLVSTDGPGTNDDHVGRSMCVDDTSDTEEADCAIITDYVASTNTWTLSHALQFTVAPTDIMWIPTQDVNTKSIGDHPICFNGSKLTNCP